MKKADLVTASAIASLMSAGYAAESFVITLNLDTLSAGSSASASAEDINFSDVMRNTETGSAWESAAQTVSHETKPEYWTRNDKLEYKELVLKWSENPSDLSAIETAELDRLEAKRARLEAPRSPNEVLAEFRTRARFSKLLASLKDVSR
jgi:hypothetical protein